MISPAQSSFYRYVLVQAVDINRDERLNVGVVAVDVVEGMSASRVVRKLDRTARALPHLPRSLIREALGSAGDRIARLILDRGEDGFEEATREWGNLVQVSPIRSIRAGSLEEATAAAFQKYVASPLASKAAADQSERPTRSPLSSRYLINGFRKRLERRGVAWEEYEFDAKLTGLSAAQSEVPVWYPIVVRGTRAFDGFDVGKDPRRAWDAARLMSQKAQETLRAGQKYHVALTVRGNSRSGDLPRELADLMRAEGRHNGSAADVHVIRELDDLHEVAEAMGIPDDREDNGRSQGDVFDND